MIISLCVEPLGKTILQGVYVDRPSAAVLLERPIGKNQSGQRRRRKMAVRDETGVLVET